MIALTTSMGRIVIELDPVKAPKTCANFEQYVRDGHYNGTIFHRIINGFMIQGGGLGPDMVAKTTRSPIENEAKNGLKNVNGSVAMARTSQPHSATSQFFINVGNNSFLDYPAGDGWGYCVFGRVTAGMEVVDAIKMVATTRKSGHQDVPIQPVMIEKMEILEAAM